MPGAQAPGLTDEIEKLLVADGDGKEGAKVRFPTLNYLDPDGPHSLRTGQSEEKESPVSSASVVT